MDTLIIGTISIILLLLLVFLGVHVAIALATSSLLGIWMLTGNFQVSVNLLSSTSYNAIKDYVFGVIPLFVLMGLLANLSGASSEIYNAFHTLFRRVRGGLGMATVGANAVFATITGVSVASAAVFSKVSLGPMTALKYDKKLALGTVAGSSVLGMLIPPSLLFIIYGMMAEVSVGKLFIAGIIPGIILALVYCLGIYLMGTLKPALVGGQTTEKQQFSKADLKVIFRPWMVGILVVLILFGLYGGWFTPTEAGAVGAFGALILVLLKRKMERKKFWDALIETGYTSASVLLLLITAQMYSRMLSMSGVLNLVEDFVNQLSISSGLLIVIFLLIIFVMGMILDSTSIMLITMPIMLPLVNAVGYDLIAFGVLAVIVTEIGLLTPPFGMVVYSMKSALGDQASLNEIFAGAVPFIIMMVITTALLFIFPGLITWLPSVMAS